jgi:GxxExxY protein
MGRLIQEELSGKIIGAAMDVLNELKPGLDEKLYERALVIELQRRGHAVEAQRRFPVFYRAEAIGDLVPDLIVDNLVIVDPKVVVAFNEAHIAQMIGYLAIHWARARAVTEFQKRTLGMEASRPTAEARI